MATFSLVEYNNYDKLNDIIINNSESIIKIYSSLIEKSIKYRSLECFDLLINMDINNINYEYKYCISLACLYYNNAPNMKNFYYLEKVVNKIISTNAKISIYQLKEFINYPLMFSQLLNNIKLDEININFCICIYTLFRSR